MSQQALIRNMVCESKTKNICCYNGKRIQNRIGKHAVMLHMADAMTACDIESCAPSNFVALAQSPMPPTVSLIFVPFVGVEKISSSSYIG